MKIENNELVVTIHKIQHQIPLSEVLFFESKSRKIHSYLADGSVISFYGTINELQSLLDPEQFIRTHQSYIVAADQVIGAQKQHLQLPGHTVMVSRTYQPAVEKQFPQIWKTIQSRRQYSKNIGCIQCERGSYAGATLLIYPRQPIVIGRDRAVCDLVFRESYISRIHCTITYYGEAEGYEVIDQSANGIYIEDGRRLPSEEINRIPAGTQLFLASPKISIRLQ